MKIPRPLLRQFHAHLEAAYPGEACGLILGHTDTVAEVVPTANVRNDSVRNRYWLDPLEHMRIERETDRRGLHVLGVYHSHPDDTAQPSAFDLDNAWPGLA